MSETIGPTRETSLNSTTVSVESSASRADEGAEYDFHCITCSDEALRVRVLSVDEKASLALVSLAESGTPEEIDISLVDAVAPGDFLLVHGGVALARVEDA